MIAMPVGRWMFGVGSIIVWTTVVNALLLAYVGWGHQWFFDWSPLFMFVGVLLITAFISDHKVAFIVSGAAALLWWYYIVGF